MKQKITPIKVILPLILLFGIFSGCTDFEEDQPTKTRQKKTLPDQESWNSTITITQNGEPVAEVWAGYIALYKDRNLAILTDSIHVDFYDENGVHNSVLTADSGIVHNRTNDLSAGGNVVVVSDSGVVLKTEQLRWDSKKQKIISEVPVRFTTQEDTLIGDSFVSDPDLKNYEIRNARGHSGRKIPLEK